MAILCTVIVWPGCGSQLWFWGGCKLRLLITLPYFPYLQPSGGMLCLQCWSLNPTSLLRVLMTWAGPKKCKRTVRCTFVDSVALTQIAVENSLPVWTQFFTFLFCNCSGLIPIALDYGIKPSAQPFLNCLVLFNSQWMFLFQEVVILLLFLLACLHWGCISTLSLNRSRLRINSIESYGHRLPDTIFSYQITVVHHTLMR